MALVTLADLRLRARQSADMVNSLLVSVAELDGYINASYAEYCDLITNAYEDHYLNDPEQFDIVSGNTFDLPSTFYKLVGLDFLDGGEWVEVKSFEWNQRNSNSSRSYNNRYHPKLRYRIQGNKLRMIPVDQATGTYRHWSIPLFVPLVDATDEIDGYNGWEEYIVIDSAIKCLRKEESSIKDHLVAKAAMIERITESSKNRDLGETHGTTDVYANGYDGGRGGYYP